MNLKEALESWQQQYTVLGEDVPKILEAPLQVFDFILTHEDVKNIIVVEDRRIIEVYGQLIREMRVT